MKRLVMGICLFALVLMAGAAAFGASFTVTKTADTSDGTCDADCSLREAVTAANATPESDTIVFSSLFNTAQTITLGGTDLIISAPGVTITGPGADKLTVSGNSASRVFTNNTAAVSTISNLRITGGTGASTVQSGRGGAVYNNAGTLTLLNLIITNNTAANGGAANNAGTATLNIVNCVLSNNVVTGAGGALQNFSGNTTNIVGSTIASNTSNSTITGGGGIQANGTVSISNSTFANNTATGGSGGAIYFNGTSMTLNNVTISGNTATSTSNGINKTTANPLSIRNSIVAVNPGGTNPDVTGAYASQGNNIIGNVGTSTGWVASDQQNVNPMLGAFGANAGLGDTFLPMPGSPAIDAGNNCVVDLSCPAGNPTVALAVDQRGIARPANSTVDIGAVEAANARIRGRVASSSGLAVKNAWVEVVYPFGTLVARTNGLGIYFVDGVQVGNSVTVTVSAKGSTFAPVNTKVTSTNFTIDLTETISLGGKQ